MAIDSIQSLDRGLEILKILAEEGRVTATAAAERLGIHQSSASRLLLSLQKAGLVRKPDFHSFAADFGLLAFAGMALENFPEVMVGAEVCRHLSQEHGCGAALATIFHGRMLYLYWTSPESPGPLRLVENSRFPIQQSSLGLLLTYRLGRQEMLDLLAGKLAEAASPDPKGEAEALRDMVERSVKANGLLDLKGVGVNYFNYAMDFETASGRFAYALFAENGTLKLATAKTALSAAIKETVAAIAAKR